MSRHHEELDVRPIQDAIATAIQWANRITRAEFMADAFAQSAIRRLSEEFRQSHPELEARRLRAVRNVLIHGYADVDLETV
jgi:uncharacterized protein with HEPN domain